MLKDLASLNPKPNMFAVGGRGLSQVASTRGLLGLVFPSSPSPEPENETSNPKRPKP